MFVPVVDQHQHPLMPTTPARARRWIQSGKATAFWKGGLFCVRLNVEPSARALQPIAVGIDPGSKREGIVVASASHAYLNIQAEARDGVKEAEQVSTRMRRTRRQRQTPYRKPRQNRKQSKQKLPPSTRARWHWKLRLARFLCQLFPLSMFTPDNRRLVCIAPLSWHHRQLHKLQPAKGGKRRREGGTLSQGIKRGTLVNHPSYGKAYVGGTMDGKLSLHHPQTGKRLTQRAKAVDCQLLKLLRWRTHLAPVTPLHRKRLFPPRSLGTGHLQAQVR